MARIRTIKPEFFRHDKLQDLECEHPGSYCMLVFAGIWGHCDKAGRFVYKPRHLKLDILPFINFDMEKTLNLIEGAGLLFRYVVNGIEYGCIPSLPEHQRFSGKEALEPVKHPDPPVKQQGSTCEATGKRLPAQEGKGVQERSTGREGKGDARSVQATDVGLFAKALDAYNSTATECDFPQAQRLTAKRAAALKARLAECGGLDGWLAAMAKARESPFLRGEDRGQGHENWRPDLDFFLQQSSFTKLLEGKYDGKSRQFGGLVAAAERIKVRHTEAAQQRSGTGGSGADFGEVGGGLRGCKTDI